MGCLKLAYGTENLDEKGVRGNLKIAWKSGAVENRYLYNGKELQEELGQYDYGARFLDPVTGRWTTIDPSAENDHSYSPYVYGFNNPARFTDPDGRWPYDGDDGEGEQKGFIRNASSGLRMSDPIKAAIVDFSFDALDALGFNAVDNMIADYKANPKGFTVADKVELGIRVLQAIDPPIGRSGKVGASPEVKISTPYKRPNNATTPAQRASVQNKPCVTCGDASGKKVADHKTPLVKEYYKTGKIDKAKMRDKESVQPQCTTCSAKQGAEMSKYSKEKKKENGL